MQNMDPVKKQGLQRLRVERQKPALKGLIAPKGLLSSVGAISHECHHQTAECDKCLKKYVKQEFREGSNLRSH